MLSDTRVKSSAAVLGCQAGLSGIFWVGRTLFLADAWTSGAAIYAIMGARKKVVEQVLLKHGLLEIRRGGGPVTR